jgi:hypothetical protein
MVFKALISADGADLMSDKTKIYYSHELLVEYTKTNIKESMEDDLVVTSSQVHQVKYLNVSTSSAFQEEPREFAWIGAPSGRLNSVCEANIARLWDLKSPGDESLFYERPITRRVDAQRIKQWLNTCDINHSGCGTPPRDVGSGLWMINVRLGMLEKIAPTGCCYAALSFCHGPNYHFFLDDENASRFGTKGFLSKTNLKIPLTIRDAISITEALGLGYLWVDTLCIHRGTSTATSENSSTPKPYLEAYRKSYVTIVATGEDAECGLFGIDSSGRKPQSQETYNGLTLAIAKKSFHDIMDDCEWNLRRWTFEEAVQSKRILIFSEEQVFFQCQQSLWAEGACLEGYNDEFIKDVCYRPVHKPYWLVNYCKPILGVSFEAYMDVVNSYSKRKSFQPADNVKAFQSFSSSPHIINHNEPLLYGLPLDRFAEALCFKVYDDMRPESERQGVPSWSWLAWNASDDVYDSTPDTLWALSFYQLAAYDENKAETWRWSPISRSEESSPREYRLPLAVEEASIIIATFRAPTLLLKFLRRDEDSPGTATLTGPLSPLLNASSAAQLSKRKVELSATLSPDYKSSTDKEMKALLVLMDGQRVWERVFRLLLIEEEPTGIFRRVGMCEVTKKEWVTAGLKNYLSFEDIFIH